MMNQILGMEDVLRGIRESLGMEVDPATSAFGEVETGVTLLLLTDQEMEQLCVYHAEKLLGYDVVWLKGLLGPATEQCRKLRSCHGKIPGHDLFYGGRNSFCRKRQPHDAGQ